MNAKNKSRLKATIPARLSRRVRAACFRINSHQMRHDLLMCGHGPFLINHPGEPGIAGHGCGLRQKTRSRRI